MSHPVGVRRRAGPSRVSRLAVASLLLALGLPVAAATADEAIDGSVIGRIAAEDILLRSGAGKTIVPSSEMLVAIAGDEDTARWVMPAETALIEALYAQVTGSDQWTAARYDDSVSATGQAAATLAGLRLAALLDDLGGRESARARLYAVAAKAQADYALVNLVGSGTVSMSANETWMLLLAIAELARSTSPDGPAAVQDELFHAWFLDGSNQLHEAATSASPSDLAGSAIAARALSAYAAVSADPSDIFRQIGVLAESASAPAGAVDTARTIRLLVAASVATGNGEYANRAGDLLEGLRADLDPETSAVAGVETLTIWELADIIGALVDAEAAGLADLGGELDQIVRHMVLDSGLMPAGPTADNPFYPHIPAAVLTLSDERIWTFASEIGYDPDSGWSVTDRSIDLAGALYAAVEMMALSEPEEAVEEAPTATGTRTVTIESTEFGFSPDMISLTQGEEVSLRLVNAGVVEHNIDIPSLGVLVTARAGETVETSFVVPGPDLAGDFRCSLPGHTEAGMAGTITIDVAPQVKQRGGSDTPVSLALPELDEAGGSPTFTTAIIIAIGFFLGMMVLVVGMLQFMKGFEDQR